MPPSVYRCPFIMISSRVTLSCLFDSINFWSLISCSSSRTWFSALSFAISTRGLSSFGLNTRFFWTKRLFYLNLTALLILKFDLRSFIVWRKVPRWTASYDLSIDPIVVNPTLRWDRCFCLRYWSNIMFYSSSFFFLKDFS